MEETLGKRIVNHRKSLGMTQDQLAERLGVTAQAVSKWENDQSCPDITMLPRLAQIFGTTTDALLGLNSQPKAPEDEIVEIPDTEISAEPGTFQLQGDNGNWEFHWDGGRKSGIRFGVWVLLTGVLLLLSNHLGWGATFWDILWPAGLVVFGLSGLRQGFSFFKLACTLFGGYFLLNHLQPEWFSPGKKYLMPILLLLFGLWLLLNALRGNGKPGFLFFRNNYVHGRRNHFRTQDTRFESAVSFGDEKHLVQLPLLQQGSTAVSFGELVLDLTSCADFSPDCHIQADCNFGELTILIPKSCRAEPATSTAFAEVQIKGSPDPEPIHTICLDCNVSFGELTIQYI